MSELRELIDATQLEGMEPSPRADLLRHVLADRRPPHGRRIFVNRTLRMEKIRYVGFDLDWTLADYDRVEMAQLAFELTLERMVERFGYPRDVLRAELRPDFLRRGQIIDTQKGTVVKMSRHRYVGRAYFGRQFLDPQERAELYRHEPVNPATERFYLVDTLFELPEVGIFSEVVEMARRHPERTFFESYLQLFRDTRKAIDSIHADGTLKSRILADLPRYLPRDPDLLGALHRLALGNRKLLLITNSEHYYTDALCSYLFADAGMPWKELFDLVIVLSGKPGFFKKHRPFRALDEAGEPAEEVTGIERGGTYACGSREDLMGLLDCRGEEVLYVGDHIYGDILSSKLTSTWRTALVVKELEEELLTRRDYSAQLRHIEVLRSELREFGLRMDDLRDLLTLYREETVEQRRAAGGDPDLKLAQRGLETMRRDHKSLRQHSKRLQARVSRAINPYWGSVFKQGGNKSLYGSQVDDFACLYTSRVSNFAYYGSQHYFRVLSDPMMHETEV